MERNRIGIVYDHCYPVKLYCFLLMSMFGHTKKAERLDCCLQHIVTCLRTCQVLNMVNLVDRLMSSTQGY